MSNDQKRQRYSRLAPLSLQDQINLSLAALQFFSGIGYDKNCEIIGKPITPDRIDSFEGSEFLIFLENSGILKDPRKYQSRIAELLARLEASGLLIYIGQGKDIFLGRRYCCLKELTTIESRGTLWLSETLGAQFVRSQYIGITTQITGIDKNGDIHAGTGLVLTTDSILTCAHVLKDMRLDNTQLINGKYHKLVDATPHPTIDIGLIRVDPGLHVQPALSFRDPRLLESMYTLGFPRVPLARSATLVMQSGEVTAPEVTLLHGADVFLYSAIARPGNSGGPIISSSGHVIGIVTEQLSAEDGKPFAPFHAGIRSSTIERALSEIAPSLTIPVEDYE